MKIIRSSLIITLITILAYSITSCSFSESDLPGTWITKSVTAEVDSTQANLSSIDQSIASEKTTRIILNADSTMALKIDEALFEGFWIYNSETEIISCWLGKSRLNSSFELGSLKGSEIIKVTKLDHGSITAVYVKE